MRHAPIGKGGASVIHPSMVRDVDPSCVGKPGWWWFALPVEADGTGPGPASRSEVRLAAEADANAKQVCRGCPLLVTCFRWGFEHERFGVYGGVSAAERYYLNGAGSITGNNTSRTSRRRERTLLDIEARFGPTHRITRFAQATPVDYIRDVLPPSDPGDTEVPAEGAA